MTVLTVFTKLSREWSINDVAKVVRSHERFRMLSEADAVLLVQHMHPLRVNAGNLIKLAEGDVEASTILLDDPNTEARVGDRLVPADVQTYDLQFFPHPPKQALDADKARVIAVASSELSAGTHEVVAISAGSADGIDNGTVVSLWRQGSNEVDRVAYGTHRGEETVGHGARTRLPDEYASHAMVFRTFDKVSYALVMESVKPTMIGYRAKHPDTK